MTDAEAERHLRILVVNWLDRENPQAGGAEEHLHQMFGRLARRGHDVTALVSGWEGAPQRAALDGLDVHRAGRRYTFSAAGPRYYHDHLAGRGFDVVVEDLNKVPMYCRLWVRAPVVLLAHHLFGRTAFQAAPFPVALVAWSLEKTIRRLYRGVPAVVVSDSTKQELVEQGLCADAIEVIPNGIDVDCYTPGPPEGRSPRPSLLFLGRLKQYKRLDLVLDAMPRVLDAGVDVELVVGGEGDQWSALRDQVARLGLEERVTFLGFVTEAQKLAALRGAWLHVLTSSKEGWGISNLEAGACATPTVASDSPGLREAVVHGETGLLVPHGDVDALAGAIVELLTDSARRDEMGRRARNFAHRYSWDASADAFEAHLRRVVARSGLD